MCKVGFSQDIEKRLSLVYLARRKEWNPVLFKHVATEIARALFGKVHINNSAEQLAGYTLACMVKGTFRDLDCNIRTRHLISFPHTSDGNGLKSRQCGACCRIEKFWLKKAVNPDPAGLRINTQSHFNIVFVRSVSSSVTLIRQNSILACRFQMKLVLVTKCSHAIAQLHKHNGRNPARFKLDGNDQRRRRQQRSDIKGNVVSVLCNVEDIHIVVRFDPLPPFH